MHIFLTGFVDIAYSFLIGGDGVVYEGRGWNTEGGHTCGFNKQSYAICFIGNFADELPDKLALKGTYIVLLDFSLTVKAATLIFISGCGSAI